MMYSGMDDPSRWVVPQVLDEQARTTPDAPWIVMTDGDRLTFGQAATDSRQVAGYLAGLGVQRGDHVAVMLPNSCDFIRAWLGLGTLGVVSVLLNTELRGVFLRHQLLNSGAVLVVVDASLAPVVDELVPELPALKHIVVVGADPAPAAGVVRHVAWEGWRDAEPYQGGWPRPQDIASIMYTSGTSGPAKGVLMPHAHCVLFGIGQVEALQLDEKDRYYIVLPLFHANGLLMQVVATLLVGIPAVVRQRFSASNWLDDVRMHDATVTNCLGVLSAFILAQPATPHDRDHHLRAILNVPNLPAHEAALRQRFGIKDVLSGFGMTEVNICIWGRCGNPRPGKAGWPYSRYFEVIIADPDTDQPMPNGQVGEILVRPKLPSGFMAGYHAAPEKTVEAWRNLWFHTGDAGIMDEEGVISFVDRIKDCIRRRSENIAATEVELAVAGLPGIAEVAAFAVPSDIPGGEDEVMLAVVPQPGVQLSPAVIGEQAEAVLPRFARPRYVELFDDLPKTATGKVQRAVLRKRGSGSAFDRSGGQGPRA